MDSDKFVPVKGLKRFLTKKGKLLGKNLFILPSGEVVRYFDYGRIEVTTDGLRWKIFGVTIGPLWLKDNEVYLQTPYNEYVYLFRIK